LDSDFDENSFYRFSEYPGYEFACLEKLRHFKVPMFYHNGHLTDLESCDMKGDSDMVDAATTNIRNDYATKILLLFSPF
jgi:hypothetical protein